MNDKGISEVVTTLLIVLLVIAAVVIVWQVVIPMIRNQTEDISSKTNCLEVSLDIVKVNNTNGAVTVTRRSGGDDDAVKDVKFLVDGSAASYTSPPAGTGLKLLETKDYTVTQASGTGKKIEVAAVLKDNSVCDIADSQTS